MKKTSIAFSVVLLLFPGLSGLSKEKKAKPWTEWTEKDAKKLLAESPWTHTQTEPDTAQIFYSATGASGGSATPQGRSALSQPNTADFHIRLLSARPVRQAFARLIELRQSNPGQGLLQQLRNFATAKSDQWIVVSLSYDSTDQRFLSDAMQAFNNTTTSVISSNTYLETKDAKPNYLTEYRAPNPREDFGAQFKFPRIIGGKPFLTEASGEVRFYCEFRLLRGVTINWRFKLTDMIVDGELEY